MTTLESIAVDLQAVADALPQIRDHMELTRVMFVLGVAHDRLKYELARQMKEKAA